ncbi:uncharacterized protein LOC115076799 isoform X3 [Rhinatrema bivittatum]|uniref:uncharacterized protein LOC115076799 isoform X3 n=1 Tax=Rhinatrema bivittatum TaxID=194408 RepID=UPI0011276AE9|nr:uncharacterized protein LOC115076799 isoform X3 [Rhinatrema bivittatum]
MQPCKFWISISYLNSAFRILPPATPICTMRASSSSALSKIVSRHMRSITFSTDKEVTKQSLCQTAIQMNKSPTSRHGTLERDPQCKKIKHHLEGKAYLLYHFLPHQVMISCQEVFTEMEEKYGEVEEMNVCDNLGDHLVGNVYVKFRREEDAEKAVLDLNNRWFNGQPIHAELSPVTDFREACCRQYEMGECTRGGFCNFMHLKPISRELRRELYGRRRKKDRQQTRLEINKWVHLINTRHCCVQR